MSQKITPYLLYEDVRAALTWLSQAYGFREELRYVEPDGTISHAEMRLDDAIIMMGHPGPDYVSPKRSGQMCAFLQVLVDDVDAHFLRAKSGGAIVISEPRDESYGIRSYRSEDLEGQRWDFSQVIREVKPEDWGATPAS